MDQTFEKLQAEVSNAVVRIYLDKKSPLMVRPAYWWHVFQQVMVLMVMISFLLYILVSLLPLSPNVWQRLGWFVGVIFPGKLGNALFAALVAIVTGLVVVVLQLYLIYAVKFRILRELLNGIYKILLMPIGFGFSLWFVYDLLIERTSLVDFLRYWVVSLNVFSWFRKRREEVNAKTRRTQRARRVVEGAAQACLGVPCKNVARLAPVASLRSNIVASFAPLRLTFLAPVALRAHSTR